MKALTTCATKVKGLHYPPEVVIKGYACCQNRVSKFRMQRFFSLISLFTGCLLQNAMLGSIYSAA